MAAAAACLPHTELEHFREFALVCDSRRGLEQLLPADAHEIADGRLGISVTEATTGANVVLQSFPTRQALLEAVWASCHIPPSCHPFDIFSLSAPPRPLRCRATFDSSEGKTLAGLEGSYIDGGLSANCPELPGYEGRTLRVSVLAGPSAPDLIAQRDSERLGAVRLPGSVYMAGLKVHLGFANLRAGFAAMGAPKEAMRRYHEMGQADCDGFFGGAVQGGVPPPPPPR